MTATRPTLDQLMTRANQFIKQEPSIDAKDISIGTERLKEFNFLHDEFRAYIQKGEPLEKVKANYELARLRHLCPHTLFKNAGSTLKITTNTMTYHINAMIGALNLSNTEPSKTQLLIYLLRDSKFFMKQSFSTTIYNPLHRALDIASRYITSDLRLKDEDPVTFSKCQAIIKAWKEIIWQKVIDAYKQCQENAKKSFTKTSIICHQQLDNLSLIENYIAYNHKEHRLNEGCYLLLICLQHRALLQRVLYANIDNIKNFAMTFETFTHLAKTLPPNQIRKEWYEKALEALLEVHYAIKKEPSSNIAVNNALMIIKTLYPSMLEEVQQNKRQNAYHNTTKRLMQFAALSGGMLAAYQDESKTTCAMTAAGAGIAAAHMRGPNGYPLMLTTAGAMVVSAKADVMVQTALATEIGLRLYQYLSVDQLVLLGGTVVAGITLGPAAMPAALAWGLTGREFGRFFWGHNPSAGEDKKQAVRPGLR